MENQIVINEQDSFNFCEETRGLKDSIEAKYLMLGKRLLFIRDNKLAETQYGGFDLYLAEIKMKQSTAEHIMRVYRRLCVELTIPETTVIKGGGYSRLYELLPLATSREKAIEVIEQASLLPNKQSIKNMVKEALGGKTNTCAHVNTIIIEVCKDCSNKIRRYDLEVA